MYYYYYYYLLGCDCDVFYSTGNCSEGTGLCECRKEYQEPNCDSCSFGYFGFPECKPCECFQNGTRGYHCEARGGACACKPNFGGKFCYQCAEGFYDFPNCLRKFLSAVFLLFC